MRLSSKYGGLQFFAPSTGYKLRIYSNDGKTVLGDPFTDSEPVVTVMSTGVLFDDYVSWTYEGTDTFLGVSTTAGATTPEYAVGATIPNTISTVFIVTKSGGVAV